MEEKIKDIYDCVPLDGNDSLVVWHNQVIEKRVDELTIADVARCIRQNMFIDSAYEVLLAYLLHNPYEGDMYDGELLEKASEVEKSQIMKHKVTISEIIVKADAFLKDKEWESEEDKEEFKNAIQKLKGEIVG